MLWRVTTGWNEPSFNQSSWSWNLFCVAILLLEECEDWRAQDFYTTGTLLLHLHTVFDIIVLLCCFKFQVMCENLKDEKALMKESEVRLMQENKSLLEHQKSQNTLVTNLQTLQVNYYWNDVNSLTNHLEKRRLGRQENKWITGWVSIQTVVLRRWEVETNVRFINRVDNLSR